MPLNNKTIVLHELVGLSVSVIKSSDPKQAGIHGTVVDETKNTLLVDTGAGRKHIVKAISTFKFKKGSRSFIVDGEEINFRSEDRLEKGLKFYKRRKL